MSKIWILDIETTLDHKIIHLVGLRELLNGSQKVFRNWEDFFSWLSAENPLFIGHNIIGFDAPVLKKVWGIDISKRIHKDTLVLSRLFDPSREGGHSLAAWGEALGFPKDTQAASTPGFFDEYSHKMADYCLRDCEVTAKLYNHLSESRFLTRFHHDSILLEHKVAQIIACQVQNGFKLDHAYAQQLVDLWEVEIEDIHANLVATFEPTIKVLKTKVKQIPFNPGSRDQIADRLIKRGWKPTKLTPTGKPAIDDEVLETIDIPEAKELHRYMLLQKRITQVKSWIEAADEDGIVHGRVITNGAVTGRMTHQEPNMAQVPASHSAYGKECRQCWTPHDGEVLVGIDAKALELCMLAHYMDDEAYTKAVVSGDRAEGTDIHTVNQKAAGLATRDQAKTFIYAFLYGAGPEKIGSIVGGGAAEGRRLIDRFLAQTPALAKLKKRVVEAYRNSGDGSLKGLDGRRLFVRSEHSALNTLLQGAGAVVMKRALRVFSDELNRKRIKHRFVANVHDEWQLSVPPEFAEEVGQVGKWAITEAGVLFQLKCPLDGDYKIGKTWAETH